MDGGSGIFIDPWMCNQKLLFYHADPQVLQHLKRSKDAMDSIQ
jgi:hypothetical protein